MARHFIRAPICKGASSRITYWRELIIGARLAPPTHPDWLSWEGGYRLDIPIQPGFNTKDQANAGFLYSQRQSTPTGGYYYLLFAGTTRRTEYHKRCVVGGVEGARSFDAGDCRALVCILCARCLHS